VANEHQQVEQAELVRWVGAAHMSRIASYMLAEVQDPLPGSRLAADDEAYVWEKCSAWTRSGLVAAIDHLIVWANIVAPQQVFEGMVVSNPPRPYFTLARGALESAAQAVWVLDQEASGERVHRHLGLLYHDLRQMALAFEAASDDRAPAVRERMKAVGERVGDIDVFAAIKNREPKYSTMVGECAGALGMEHAELEVLWRGASAAAHGKNWFRRVGYTAEVDDEYEPGYYRVMLQPDPAAITRLVTAAARLTLHGVLRFIDCAGYDFSPLEARAMARLRAETALEIE
jgi:hypothetical protein